MWARYFAVGEAQLTEIMVRAIVCRAMGWTWQEYEEQPNHFIDVIIAMLKAQNEKNKQE